MQSDASTPFGAVLTEFIEALVHQILFLREVYDPDLFDRHRLYSIAVRKASHPGVLEYVQSLAHSLKDGLEKGFVKKIIVVIINQGSQVIEKHVLDLQLLQPDRLRQMSPIELEAALRSILLKLQYTKAILQPLPAGCTFTVLACAEGAAGLPMDKWAEEAADEASPAAPAGYAIATRHELQPVKTASVSRALHLQLSIDSSLFTSLS